MRTDEDIRRDVEAELVWEPDLDSTDISVKVEDGIVTLTGFVKSYSEKYQAERDAKRVLGVKAVVNDLVVKLASGTERLDREIAEDALDALKRDLPISSQGIQVVVRDGAAVGVELLARLEHDGVHPALRVGQLHPVADDERAGHRLRLLDGLDDGLLLGLHGRPGYGRDRCDPCPQCGAGARNCRWGDLASDA